MSAIEQKWSARDYAANARFVSDLAEGVLGWLRPEPGERILDLGCGEGALSQRLMRAGCHVVGCDIDEDMIAAARARGVRVVRASGENLPFEREFNAVFSNAALHWMTAPRAVLEGVFRALRPGGRFVGEMGGHGNVAAIITAMRAVARMRGGDEALAGPWFFPTPEDYRDLLEKAGFSVRRVELIARPTPLPAGMSAWLKTFRGVFFTQFGKDAPLALAEVEDLLRPVLCDAAGRWTADYMRLRFEAWKD